ncbi:MAG: hypothetical protein ACOYEA_04095 [Fermentimonas sp.]|jgi:hypothetical protein
MKIRITILLLFITVINVAYSQDYIYTIENRNPIEAVVFEINDMDVLYKTFDNPNGPDYRISVTRVMKIVFENGTERYFNDYGRVVEPYSMRDPYPYLRYRWGGIYNGPRRLDSQEVMDYFGYFEYGSKYLMAKRKVAWGISLAAIGLGAVAFGTSRYLINEDAPEFHDEFLQQSANNISPAEYWVPWSIGVACLGIGIPIWISGDKQILNMLDDYNSRRRKHKQELSLNIGITSTGGLGFILNF